MSKDTQHLDLLAIFHYVVAGLTALGSLIPLIHLTIGIGMASGRFAQEDPLAREIGLVFIFIASVLIVMGLTFAVFVVLAGRNLRENPGSANRSRRWPSVATAAKVQEGNASCRRSILSRKPI